MSHLLLQRTPAHEVQFTVRKWHDGTFSFDVGEIYDEESDGPAVVHAHGAYCGPGFTREHLIKLAKFLLVQAEVREWMVDDAPRTPPAPSRFSKLIAAEVAKTVAQKAKD